MTLRSAWLFLSVLTVWLSAQDVRTVPVISGLSRPVDIQSARDGSGRLFLVQQNGLILIYRAGSLLGQPFLDIRSKTVAGGERGLLGLAFSPVYSRSGRFYLNYTDLNGNTVIAQYRVSSDPNTADVASETVLLRINQPFANHNGGQLRFGPDGYLYIGMGDGGSGGDPRNYAQSLDTLLGKMLRVDVESDPGRIRSPESNPFVNQASARPEIWAYGLRNPWRFSFDRATGDLYIADVGQNLFEEVDFQPVWSRGGENYGWNRMEGAHCYLAGCDSRGLTLPVAEYPHGPNNVNCSVTGGFVYRGTRSPGLRGLYLYGDYCSGVIWALEWRGGQWFSRQVLSSGFDITTFGEDEDGEIYVADSISGTIHRIEGSQDPRYWSSSATNAASFAPGLVAGSLATVFAAGVRDTPGSTQAQVLPLPPELDGVKVMLDGNAVPLLAVANTSGTEQVNFQVPFDLAGRNSVSLVVSRNGQQGLPVNVPLLAVQPAIYSSGGTAAIVVHNVGYTLVTRENPLVPGEVAFLYASGLGQVSNPPAAGVGAPLQPLSEALLKPSLSLGNRPAEVLFAGLAPGLAGVFQVNFRVPAGVASGSQPLVLTSGALASPVLVVPVRGNQ